MCSDTRAEANLAALLSWKCYSMFKLGRVEEAAVIAEEYSNINRRLLAKDGNNFDMHQFNLCWSLFWLAKCLQKFLRCSLFA